MQFPKLTQLQSRFAASLLASFVLIIIYWLISNPRFADAVELSSTAGGPILEGEDHNWERLEDIVDARFGQVGLQHIGETNQATLVGAASSTATTPYVQERAIASASASPSTLPGSNIPLNKKINSGTTDRWLLNTDVGNWTVVDYVYGLPSGFDQAEDPVISNGSGTPPDPNTGPSTDLASRQTVSDKTFYISINTCLQPTWNATSTQSAAPPQLTLYVSTNITSPGPEASSNEQQILPLDEGFISYALNTSSQVYISVAAPDLPENFSGAWTYELAASVDDYYHRANGEPFLYLIDTDTASALLVTDNLTLADAGSAVFNKWMNMTPPFILFAQNANYTGATSGVTNSFCGLRNAPAQFSGDQEHVDGEVTNVQMGMTVRGLGNKPKQQFYVTALNGSSDYLAYLAMQGNATAHGSGVVGGGGQVWQPVPFHTKSDGNCALLFNLSFCAEVAYAVPSNPNTFPSIEDLSSFYDEYAQGLFQNFSYSLQLIPCNTTSSAQYSLARNCQDCSNAYKEWLCAVTIPRCDDFSNTTNIWTKPRNVGQPFFQNHSMLPESYLQQPFSPMPSAPGGSVAFEQTYGSTFASNRSRVGRIDDAIKPGPYRELLPCEDLCYSLMQSCPAALGFSCPLPGRGLEASYNPRVSSNLTCSYLGAYYSVNKSARLGFSFIMMQAGLFISMLTVWSTW